MKTNPPPLPIRQYHITPQSGTAFTIKHGQVIRVIDVEGGQVSDLFCFAEKKRQECLSSGQTTDYNGKLFLSKGDILYSNSSNPMFTIIADQVGGHIMLYPPCSQKMFEKSYGVTEAHPNCLENLLTSLKDFTIEESLVSIPLNLFMSIDISEQGTITIQPARSKAGAYVELRAEMDMIVAVTSCSAGTCNNFKWTSIDVEIYAPE